MGKSLCKWKKKEIEHNALELMQLIKKPRYYCKECARSAHNKQVLCKAIKME